jgi:hypothetical protein
LNLRQERKAIVAVVGQNTFRESPEVRPWAAGLSPDLCHRFDGAKVALVSDALANVEPKPDNWLNKDFFKIEKLRAISITSAIDTNSWKLTRETETGDWTLADKKEGEELDKGKSSSVSYALSSPSFNDVVSPGLKPEETGMDKPVVASLEHSITLCIRSRRKKTGEDNYHGHGGHGGSPKERLRARTKNPRTRKSSIKSSRKKLRSLRRSLIRRRPLRSGCTLCQSGQSIPS